LKERVTVYPYLFYIFEQFVVMSYRHILKLIIFVCKAVQK